jgi:adenylate kinase
VTSIAAAGPAARPEGGRRIIVLLGAPGAGKGTQAERLATSLGLPHVSTGELFRAALKGETALGAKVRKTGFPRTVAQAMALDEMLASRSESVCAALYVEVSTDLLTARLTGRRICTVDDQHVYHVVSRPPRTEGLCDMCGAELYQRPDDSVETVQSRLDTQLPPMYEVIDHYAENRVLFSVRGDADVDTVTDDLLRALATIRAAE